MSNRSCHKLVSKALRGIPKEMREAAHAAAHAHYNGGGFDNWKVVMGDKLLYKKGLHPGAFCKEELQRNWIDQPD